MFVQCSTGGAVVGVVDYYNIGTQIERQNKAIKAIASRLNISVNF
jgi:hypothetical protein